MGREPSGFRNGEAEGRTLPPGGEDAGEDADEADTFVGSERVRIEPGPGLGEGDPVEVRVGYTGDWSAGFEVASVVAGGYQVRRTNDGYLLPAPTGPADIRRVG